MILNPTVIILIVVAFAFYLIYSQNSQPKIVNASQLPLTKSPPINNAPIYTNQPCQNCEFYKKKLSQSHTKNPSMTVTIENEHDKYADQIKKQDLHSMYDHLSYPLMRLPREVLEKYNEYYEKNGTQPPFNNPTRPLFDNPILNGLLIKQIDDNEPFSDSVPTTIPLFRLKSAKNTNRFFYYIIDQRYMSKLELKIPLDHIKINGVRYNNADFYGLPELYDGDLIENISIYPNSKFKIILYKTYHFP